MMAWIEDQKAVRRNSGGSLPTLFGNLFLFDERVVMMANNFVVMKKEKNKVHISCQPLQETLPKAQRTRGLSSYYRISIKHQLQNFNQTSASQLNLKLKSWPNLASEYWPRFNFVTSSKHQRQNADQTSASKSRLNFNFKILIKPCAQSLNKSLALWPNLSFQICNKLMPTQHQQNLSSKILTKLQLKNFAWTSTSKSWPKCTKSE